MAAVFVLSVAGVTPADWSLVEPWAVVSHISAGTHPTVLGATETSCAAEPHINQRLVANIEAACAAHPTLTVVINLYDQHNASGSTWKHCLGALPECVAHVANTGGMKVMFWTYVLTPAFVRAFDYVWCCDDDMFVGSFDLDDAIHTMEIGNISMAQPVVFNATTAHLVNFSLPTPKRRLLSGTEEVALSAANPLVPSSCRAQSVERVEVQTPMVHRAAWTVLHEEVWAHERNAHICGVAVWLCELVCFPVCRALCGVTKATA